MLFYIAKGLEVTGLVSVGMSVLQGVMRGESPDVGFFLAGVAVFYAGRLLEKHGAS